MGELTENLPKGMLSVNGKTLIERQIAVLRQLEMDEIVVVTGFQAEKIRYEGITYRHNPRYATTNMVETLLCAREDMTDDVLVAYSDIVYSDEVAKAAKLCRNEIGVVVDEAWRDYWLLRYGTTETDLESLTVSNDGLISDIGRPIESSEGLKYRYVGLIKFSRRGILDILAVYDKKKLENSFWRQSGNPFEKGYMTDFLNEAIISGLSVQAIAVKGGWCEFDTMGDYEAGCKMIDGIG